MWAFRTATSTRYRLRGAQARPQDQIRASDGQRLSRRHRPPVVRPGERESYRVARKSSAAAGRSANGVCLARRREIGQFGERKLTRGTTSRLRGEDAEQLGRVHRPSYVLGPLRRKRAFLNAASRVLKKSVAWGRNREHNGIQRSPERNRTAAEMSFSTAC